MKSIPLIVSLALLLITSGTIQAADEKLQIVKDSETIIIADFTTKDLPVPEALNKLEELSQKSDPTKKGIAVLLDKQIDSSKLKVINLNLKDVPVSEVIRIISALSGLEPKAEEKAIILVARKS